MRPENIHYHSLVLEEESSPFFVSKGFSSNKTVRRKVIYARIAESILTLLFIAIILLTDEWNAYYVSITVLAFPIVLVIVIYAECIVAPELKSSRPLKIAVINPETTSAFVLVQDKAVADINEIDRVDIIRGKGQQVLSKGTGTWWSNAPSHIVVHMKNGKKIDLGYKHPLFAIKFKDAMIGLGVQTTMIGSGIGEFSRYENGKLVERTNV